MRKFLSRSLNEYGMLLVLLLLCAYYACVTIKPSATDGPAGGESCAKLALSEMPAMHSAAIVVGTAADAIGFANAAKARLTAAGVGSIRVMQGGPPEVRQQLSQSIAASSAPDAILTTTQDAAWVERIQANLPAISRTLLVIPKVRRWPVFLTVQNLLNIGDQIAVIAVVAVGMTMVILTGGIDLSVGSLAALSAVAVSLMIRDWAGGVHAGTMAMLGCSLLAMAICGLVGVVSGSLITLFRVPPFIVTLAVMQIASGQANEWSKQQSIHDIPASFTWLGKGASLLGLPNTLVLMVLLYVLAHVLLSRMRLGRYIYAVGGNSEAARLSGVNVNWVILIVYFISGLSAGLGGLILTSELQTGSATYGVGLELFAIAAVVLGGTSLSGGEGNVIGTLIGAFIIAVLHNGMDLTDVNDARQRTVLGLVILGGVLADQLKRRPWSLPSWLVSRNVADSETKRSPAEKTLIEEKTI